MNDREKKELSGVFLVYGEDEFAVSKAARERLRQAVPAEAETFGLEIVRGEADTVEEALACIRRCREAIQTVGFLDDRKAVWLRGANFLDQGALVKSKDVRAALQDLADAFPGMPPGRLLVISAPAADIKSEFYKACAGAGEVLAFKSEKPWQRDNGAMAFAGGAFRELGISAGEDVMRAFVHKVGTDSRRLRQEAEKLDLYLGAVRKAQTEDVEAVVSPGREMFTWNLEDALGNRDMAEALRIMRQLLFQGEKPIRLMLSIESRFRCLLILREAMDRNWVGLSGKVLAKRAMSAEQEQLFYQALNDNRMKNPFVAGIRARQASCFSRAELEACRARILETRRQLVSSGLPPKLALELLVVRLCRRPERSAGARRQKTKAA